MVDVIILEALDQFGLKHFWNAVAPLHVSESGRLPAGREQHTLGLQHDDSGRLRNRDQSLDRLFRSYKFFWRDQIVRDLLRRRSTSPSHALEAGDDVVETTGVLGQTSGKDLQIGNRVLQGLG